MNNVMFKFIWYVLVFEMEVLAGFGHPILLRYMVFTLGNI